MRGIALLRRYGAIGLAVFVLSHAVDVQAADQPKRVIAIGGAVTEIVARLDRMDTLVAVDSTSTYPEAATDLPDVGYMRRLSAEPIIALEPDRVLAVADAGPPVVFDQLRDAGIAISRIPDEPTPAGVVQKVRAVAAELGIPERGERLANRLERKFAALQERIAATEQRPRVLTLIAAGPGNLMVAGRETAAAGIVELAGGRNAMDAYRGYRPLASEAVIEVAPDWIVLTNAALDSLGGRTGLRERPGLGTTPAVRDGRIVPMDGLVLLGFGPRTPTVAAELAADLHPQGLKPHGSTDREPTDDDGR